MIMERSIVLAGILVLFTTLSLVEAGGRKAIETCIQGSELVAEDFLSLVKSEGPTQNFKMQEDGTLSTDGIASQFDPSAIPALEACVLTSQHESEVCQKSFLFISCSIMAKPKDIIGFLLAE